MQLNYTFAEAELMIKF